MSASVVPEATKASKRIGSITDAVKDKDKIAESVKYLEDHGFTVGWAKKMYEASKHRKFARDIVKYRDDMAKWNKLPKENRPKKPSRPTEPTDASIDKGKRLIDKRWEGDYSRDVTDVLSDVYKMATIKPSYKNQADLKDAADRLKSDGSSLEDVLGSVRDAADKNYEARLARYDARVYEWEKAVRGWKGGTKPPKPRKIRKLSHGDIRDAKKRIKKAWSK